MTMTILVIGSKKGTETMNLLTREVGTIRQQASNESSRPQSAVVDPRQPSLI